MTKRILTAAAAAALLVPALAFAEVVVVNGEAGMIFKDAPSTITRDQIRAELKSGKTGDAHFKYVGGEAGWIHESPTHRMLVENGKLVHASDCPVMASMSAPKTTPTGSNDLVYTGA
jgi:hypothetical protein